MRKKFTSVAQNYKYIPYINKKVPIQELDMAATHSYTDLHNLFGDSSIVFDINTPANISCQMKNFSILGFVWLLYVIVVWCLRQISNVLV